MIVSVCISVMLTAVLGLLEVQQSHAMSKGPVTFIRNIVRKPAPSTPTSLRSIPDTVISELRHLREEIRMWAQTCPDGSMSSGDCPFGDMTLFSGISCLVGEEARCEDVRRAQGSDGRWWRSPAFVDDEKPNSFSRDQTLGLLAYFLKAAQTDRQRTQDSAKQWLKWVISHGNKTCNESNGRCWLYPELYPQHWALIGHIWDSMGLKKNLAMKSGEWIEDQILFGEAKTAPDGYPTHLVGVVLLIRQELSRLNIVRVGTTARKAIEVLTARQPRNPFFLYLRDGRNENSAQLVLEKCPKQPPAEIHRSWSWQRPESEAAWLRSMGWECIFMIDLLVGPV